MADVQTRQPTQQLREETKQQAPPQNYGYGVNAIYNKKMGGLIRGSKLLTLKSSDTVGSALTMLATRYLTSAPVWDEEKNEYGNYLDMLDLLSLLISMSGKEIPETGESLNLTTEDIERLNERSNEFLTTKIGSIAGSAGLDKIEILGEDQNLGDAIEKYLKGCHRVLIADNDNNLIGVVSQSTVAKYLEENLHRIQYDPCFKDTVWNFPFKSTSMHVVSENAIVLDAFAHMRANNFLALGVIDNQGRLVGNLSATDLQSWHLFGNFKRLGWSVGRFLRSVRKVQARSPKFVVTVPRNTTVTQLLTFFRIYNVHRIYIVDDNGLPSGLITLTDLMRGLSVKLHKGHYQGPEVFAKETKDVAEKHEVTGSS